MKSVMSALQLTSVALGDILTGIRLLSDWIDGLAGPLSSIPPLPVLLSWSLCNFRRGVRHLPPVFERASHVSAVLRADGSQLHRVLVGGARLSLRFLRGSKVHSVDLLPFGVTLGTVGC